MRPTTRRHRSVFDSPLPIIGVCVVLAVLLGWIGWTLWQRGPSRTDHRVEGRPAPLSIVTGQFDALPDLMPTLLGDTLLVRVSYDGDCEDHRFGLDSETRGDTLLLRLTHNDAGDGCTGRVYDELHLHVPKAARDVRVVALADPEGGAPFALVRPAQKAAP